jgi:ketosteroid isomerase-like protein
MTIMQLQAGIQATNATFRAAIACGDSASIAALYTEVGAVLSTNNDIVRGKSVIQVFWQYALQGLGLRAAELETLELAQVGSIIYEVGQYTLRGEWAIILEQGRYVVIWQQEGGEWKRYRDSFNCREPVTTFMSLPEGRHARLHSHSSRVLGWPIAHNECCGPYRDPTRYPARYPYQCANAAYSIDCS